MSDQDVRGGMFYLRSAAVDAVVRATEGPTLSDRVRALAAREERLREALREIVSMGYEGASPDALIMSDVARGALTDE